MGFDLHAMQSNGDPQRCHRGTDMTAKDLSAHIPANAVRWLRPVCLLAYTAGVVAVVIGAVLNSMLVSVIAIILLLVGLCSMACCCISKGSLFEK